MKETDDKIVIFGEHDKYKVDKNTPLPTGEPVDNLAKEEEDILQRMFSRD